jgi:hypothetical protein
MTMGITMKIALDVCMAPYLLAPQHNNQPAMGRVAVMRRVSRGRSWDEPFTRR